MTSSTKRRRGARVVDHDARRDAQGADLLGTALDHLLQESGSRARFVTVPEGPLWCAVFSLTDVVELGHDARGWYLLTNGERHALVNAPRVWQVLSFFRGAERSRARGA
jgi:hypothetical protein